MNKTVMQPHVGYTTLELHVTNALRVTTVDLAPMNVIAGEYYIHQVNTET